MLRKSGGIDFLKTGKVTIDADEILVTISGKADAWPDSLPGTAE